MRASPPNSTTPAREDRGCSSSASRTNSIACLLPLIPSESDASTTNTVATSPASRSNPRSRNAPRRAAATRNRVAAASFHWRGLTPIRRRASRNSAATTTSARASSHGRSEVEMPGEGSPGRGGRLSVGSAGTGVIVDSAAAGFTATDSSGRPSAATRQRPGRSTTSPDAPGVSSTTVPAGSITVTPDCDDTASVSPTSMDEGGSRAPVSSVSRRSPRRGNASSRGRFESPSPKARYANRTPPPVPAKAPVPAAAPLSSAPPGGGCAGGLSLISLAASPLPVPIPSAPPASPPGPSPAGRRFTDLPVLPLSSRGADSASQQDLCRLGADPLGCGDSEVREVDALQQRVARTYQSQRRSLGLAGDRHAWSAPGRADGQERRLGRERDGGAVVGR